MIKTAPEYLGKGKEKGIFPEIPHRHIQRISIVIPMLNEKDNVEKVIHNLQSQELHSDRELYVFISDNGSTDDTTLQAYKKMLDGKFRKQGKHMQFFLVEGSITGRLGSARKVGVEAAIETFQKDHPKANPTDHVLFGFDADTRLQKPDMLERLAHDLETNPNAQLAFGPLPIHTNDTRLLIPIVRALFDFFPYVYRYNYDYGIGVHNFGIWWTRRLLRHAFTANNRHPKQFLNDPFFLFPGPFEAFTQEAYQEAKQKQHGVFHSEDSSAEDASYTISMLRTFDRRQIVFDKKLQVPFSVREVENEKGQVIPGKIIERIFTLLRTNEHVSATLKSLIKELEAIDPQKAEEFTSQLQNSQYGEVVGNHIRRIEQSVFCLTQYEYIDRYTRLRRKGTIEKQDPTTGKKLRARIQSVPSALFTTDNEYVVKRIKKRQFLKTRREEDNIGIDPKDSSVKSYKNNRRNVYVQVRRFPDTLHDSYTIKEATL